MQAYQRMAPVSKLKRFLTIFRTKSIKLAEVRNMESDKSQQQDHNESNTSYRDIAMRHHHIRYLTNRHTEICPQQ